MDNRIYYGLSSNDSSNNRVLTDHHEIEGNSSLVKFNDTVDLSAGALTGIVATSVILGTTLTPTNCNESKF